MHDIREFLVDTAGAAADYFEALDTRPALDELASDVWRRQRELDDGVEPAEQCSVEQRGWLVVAITTRGESALSRNCRNGVEHSPDLADVVRMGSFAGEGVDFVE